MNTTDCGTVMVCIATQQNAANILPVMTVRPDVVVVAVSGEMKARGDALKQWLQKHGDYRPEHIVLKQDLPSHGVNRITDYALNLLIDLKDQWSDYRLILNATGGNKLMTLAFVDVFRQEGVEQILYADTDHDVLEVVEPAKTPSIPISSTFTIAGYLDAQDRIARQPDSDKEPWCDKANERKALTKWLVEHIQDLMQEQGGGILPQLNKAAANALDKNGGLKPNEHLQTLNYVGYHGKRILKKLKEEGIFEWSEERPETLYFSNAEAARYIKGRWLEEYVWHIARDSDAEHVAAGLDIHDGKHRKDDVRNELDLVIVHNNRLLLVECKTSQMQKDKQKDADIIHKLDSIGSHAGGLFCERMLVSAAPMDYENQKGRKIKVVSRAKSYDIDVLQYNEIKQFRDIINHWVNTGDLSGS
ncbi:DUF1887 family CARF protein [Endozoicomonas gorgoniicola]|uniref:DUF1887 family CARF protein n=1 Tax=Endozoicomonas gorgoniicola TaxID=1234144 RepID=A0ABT3MT61_9GAMM|nr:DUF1887 family CARF protein [Endozoicomonas gorgoniicola]MCW7552283.1 DUF1887 family CARF protein [Endozoicomonas gorgoniicola]